MLQRKPVAAGRFYSGNAQNLDREVENYMYDKGDQEKMLRPFACMLPHAGYIFCGDVIGKTLEPVELPERLIILCPNHTGMGQTLGVWPEGKWTTPLGDVEVDNELARKICESSGGFKEDIQSHLGEHSIEVLLPFLQKKIKNLKIVPICIGTQNPQILKKAANALAEILNSEEGKAGLIISSDMNHYENEQITLLKDMLAINQILEVNPEGLLSTVAQNQISMCGVAPMALALFTARELGKPQVELVDHTTSAKASGDASHTVGYAGLRMYL